MSQEIIGDLPVVSDNYKFLGKFHSGTLRIMDTMRIMSHFQLFLEHPLDFVSITSLFEGIGSQIKYEVSLNVEKAKMQILAPYTTEQQS